VDLNIAGADGRRGTHAGADLQHRSRTRSDNEEQLIRTATSVMIVDGTRDKVNRNGRLRISTDAADDSGAVEVNDAHVHFRRSCWVAGAGVDDDLLSREMQAAVMINDVPVAAFRGFRAAAGIHNAAVAEVRSLAFAECSATGHPAATGRRSVGAKISAETHVNERGVFGDDFDVLAVGINLGTRRQRGLVNADGIVANVRNLQNSDAQRICQRAAGDGTSDANSDAGRRVVVGTRDSYLNKACGCRESGQCRCTYCR